MSLMNISLKHLYSIIFAFIFLLLILIFVLSLLAAERRLALTKTEAFRYNALKIANELENSSDELTLMARLYVVTGNQQYKKNYFSILAMRNGELGKAKNYSSRYWDFVIGAGGGQDNSGEKQSYKKDVDRLNLPKHEENFLNLARERSDDLAKVEIRAFNLKEGLYPDAEGNYTIRGEPNSTTALNLVFGNEYLQAKYKIMQPIEQFLQSIDERTQSHFKALQSAQLYWLLVLIALIFVCVLLVFFTVLLFLQHLKQIKKLLEHVNKIKLKDYNSRNDLNSKNELGVLGNTLNQMCQSINTNINEYVTIEKNLSQSEERFRSVIENSPYGIAIGDLNGKFIQVNDSFCNQLGYTKEELLTLRYHDISETKDIPIDERLIKQLINGEIPSYTRDKVHIRKDGTKIWTSLSVSLIKDSSGKPQFLVGQLLDINDRIDTEYSLLELSEKMADTVKNLKLREKEELLLNKLNETLQLCMNIDETYPRIGVIGQELLPDLSGGLTIYNKQTQNLDRKLEWGGSKLLLPTFAPMDCFGLRRGTVNIVEGPTKGISCVHYVSQPKGESLCVPLIVLGETIGVIHIFSREGESISFSQQQVIFSFCNVIKLALSNIMLLETLHEQSIHDSLTGLYNRRFLDETLSRELLRATRNKTSVCVAMLDLDFFKKFNDTYGHEAGDVVLRYIGKLLQTNFRGSDIASRFGGEEFVVVLPDVNLKSALMRLEKVCQETRNARLFYQEEPLGVIALSGGLAIAPEHGNTADTILRAADLALYYAKESGRDRIVIYDPKMQLMPNNHKNNK